MNESINQSSHARAVGESTRSQFNSLHRGMLFCLDSQRILGCFVELAIPYDRPISILYHLFYTHTYLEEDHTASLNQSINRPLASSSSAAAAAVVVIVVVG